MYVYVYMLICITYTYVYIQSMPFVGLLRTSPTGVEGFGVVTDYLVIEMGWVILNIVSKRPGCGFHSETATSLDILNNFKSMAVFPEILGQKAAANSNMNFTRGLGGPGTPWSIPEDHSSCL